MPTRQKIAEVLQGFFALWMAVLLGMVEALFFHWHGGRRYAAIAVICAIPLAGAIKTRQRYLLLGMLIGIAAAFLFHLLSR